MNKAFEKILEKLEERTSFLSDCMKYGNKDAEQQNKSYSTMMMYEVADLVDDLIEIVKQETEQFGNDINVGSNGWISCSERLPDVEADVLLSLRSIDVHTGFMSNTEGYFYVDGEGYVEFENVLAWQPLPQPYQPKGEHDENTKF